MRHALASLVVAASLLSVASSEGVGLGLPRGRYRLGRLRAQLHHRCQAHRAASMRELQPDPGLHDPVVSARRLKSPGNSARGYAARCRDDGHRPA
jgi:hypothetical protein